MASRPGFSAGPNMPQQQRFPAQGSPMNRFQSPGYVVSAVMLFYFLNVLQLCLRLPRYVEMSVD